MFLSTDRPVGYPSIQHLASIAEEATNDGMFLNSPAEEPLTQENREKLNFPDVRTFVRHVELAPREVYDSIIRL